MHISLSRQNEYYKIVFFFNFSYFDPDIRIITRKVQQNLHDINKYG